MLQVLKEKPADPTCYPAAAPSEADSRSSATCVRPLAAPPPPGLPPQQPGAGRRWKWMDVACNPSHHAGSLNAACEARREAQPAMCALGNCRFCPPRHQDAHCPVPSPTWLQRGGASCPWRRPSPGRPVCTQSPALLATSVAHSLSPSFHLDLRSDPMSFWSSHLLGTGQSI